MYMYRYMYMYSVDTYQCSDGEVGPKGLRDRPVAGGYVGLGVALDVDHLYCIVPLVVERNNGRHAPIYAVLLDSVQQVFTRRQVLL